jgi:YVTN family beta-propeller protein
MKLLLPVLFAVTMIAAENPYHVAAKYAVPGDGGWDYVTFDPGSHHLFLSHGNQVDVLDTTSGQVAGTIPDTPGVHGALVAGKYGFTTNGRENKSSVFDPATLKLIKKIDVGKGPDGIFYHVATKRVFTCNHGSDDVSVIDANTAELIGTVKVEGGGESMIAAKDGLIYLNLEDKGEVVVFDPKSLEVKRHIPIGVAGTPTGLDYDPATDRLFIGCREKPLLVVMEASTGKVVTTFPIGTGVDWVIFDRKNNVVFASNGDGTLSTVRVKPHGEYEQLDAVKTEPGAKTMALDPATGTVYLSTADVVITPAAKAGERPKRAVTPGTFHVLAVKK